MLIQFLLTFVFLSLWLRILQRRTVGVIFKIISTLIILAAIYIVLRPDITNRVARIVGVGRGADLTIYICMAVGFYMLTTLYLRLKDTENRLARLIQHIAVEGAMANLMLDEN